MENKLTNVEMCRLRQELLKNDVMSLLKISELEYNEMIFEQGLRYIESYIRGSINEASNISYEVREKMITNYIQMLTYSKVYWAWFKNHWSLRDLSFLSIYNSLGQNVDSVRMTYTKLNDGKFLASPHNPSKVILERSYCEMVETLLVKEQNK